MVSVLYFNFTINNYNLDGLTKEEGAAYVAGKLRGAGCNQSACPPANNVI